MRVDKLVEELRKLPPYAEILIAVGAKDEMNGQVLQRFEPVMSIISMYNEMPVEYCQNRYRLSSTPSAPDSQLIINHHEDLK